MLKSILDTMKGENYLVKKLDQYLITSQKLDNDRRWDINSPSMSSSCSRAIYYSRTGTEYSEKNSSRGVRILDNGTHVHSRLEDYLLKAKLIYMNEVPVFNFDYLIQGHCDFIFPVSRYEIGVGEIKSMNDAGFRALKDAKPEHKTQAFCYMFCLEQRRLYLTKYKSKLKLVRYLQSNEYKEMILRLYSHLEDGSKYTRKEKLAFKTEQHKRLDNFLWKTKKPIRKMVFLYENKNDQNFKEFCVEWDNDLLAKMMTKFVCINEYVNIFRESIKEQSAKKELTKKEIEHIRYEHIPPREGTSKSCQTCRWCKFKNECWIV